MNSVSIRKCLPADLEQLLRISTTTFYEAFVDRNTEEAMSGYMNEAFTLEKLESELTNPESDFYFAYYDKELAGYFKLNTGQAQVEKYEKTTIELARLYVVKEFRNKKIGEFMLNKAIEIGENMGATFIWLGVWDRNPDAIRFYERHGFRKYGEHPFYMGKERQTDYLFRKFLDDSGE